MTCRCLGNQSDLRQPSFNQSPACAVSPVHEPISAEFRLRSQHLRVISCQARSRAQARVAAAAGARSGLASSRHVEEVFNG
ncbi:hypothetical protein Q7C36_010273 [Tachysurus vachellii]|uniref:Uncharacterized protein n=1 Tax=Tachysurus vachellii TaxID=175792 RepID=A0AA88STY1_TACVA|nr:hypothetical protein Q7C36_010273 [Tachysurus vachellii]